MKNLTWTRDNGDITPISEMHDNHLMNAYSLSVRTKKTAERPGLAAEIRERNLVGQLPAYASAAILSDLAQV